MLGRFVAIKKNSVLLAGMTSKSLDKTIEWADNTTDTHNGVKSSEKIPTVVSMSLSGDGMAEDSVLADLIYGSDGEDLYLTDITVHFEPIADGMTVGASLSGDWTVTSFSMSAANEPLAFSIAMESSGPMVWTPEAAS